MIKSKEHLSISRGFHVHSPSSSNGLTTHHNFLSPPPPPSPPHPKDGKFWAKRNHLKKANKFRPIKYFFRGAGKKMSHSNSGGGGENKHWARLPMNPLHQYAHSYLVVCCGSCLTKCVETNYLNTDFRDEYKEGLYRSKEMYSFQSKRM